MARVRVQEEERKMALVAKERGNAALKDGHFQKAFDMYTEAISLDTTNPIYLANRAQVALKLEQFGTAIADATEAIELDPNYLKSYYRRGTAYCGILDYTKALADFTTVAKRAPSDVGAQTRLTECRRLIRMQAFLKAIEVEDEPSIFESLDINSFPDNDDFGQLDTDKVSLDFVHKLVAHFKQGGRISRRKLYQIIKAASDLFAQEPTMPEIDVGEGETITVCGDTHGQFFDLVNILDTNGWPSKTHKYLFNGDFVDRGSWSTEIVLTLYALKLALPHSLYLNRGNHETDSMNLTYGFSGECKAKYASDMVFKAFSESFSKLPLAALIGNTYLVLHGGLFSDDDVTLEDIRKLDRFKQRQPGQDGLMMEMLWTDPQSAPGRAPSKRGIGLQFGPDVTQRFCRTNKLKAVIRSHEVREWGYSLDHNGQLITVFSAPNYCDSQGNKGAYINIGHDMKLDFVQFEAVAHPDIPAMAYASGVMR